MVTESTHFSLAYILPVRKEALRKHWNLKILKEITVVMLKLEHSRRNKFMVTSSNGNIFRVTGHLCGEFTGPRWIPHTKASDAELWCFFFYLCPNKRLSKQSWGWWFETLSCPLWRHRNAISCLMMTWRHQEPWYCLCRKNVQFIE